MYENSVRLAACVVLLCFVLPTAVYTTDGRLVRHVEDLSQEFNSLKIEYLNMLRKIEKLDVTLATQDEALQDTWFKMGRLEEKVDRQTSELQETKATIKEQKARIDYLEEVENTRRLMHYGNGGGFTRSKPMRLHRPEKRTNVMREVVKKQNTGNVAFSATRTSPLLGDSSEAQNITFDLAFVNEGDDFDLDTGIFTCEVEGTYYFSFTMRSYDAKHIGVILMKGNEGVVSMATDADDRSVMQTQSVMLTLSVGDLIYLRLTPSEDFAIYGNSFNYITFNSFLVFA
ncbi:uncharacterized protein LOC102801095 [Saccoglossus kowalevskii]|uniref:Uncharacterized protein LOC102801095 n=1 Tax=Saccoglossus kowalevskii TaxID=10224 RepID=A0ABM0MMP9_SACKO|nr:PREDICTED: uncharacterized protein LOC102801095 [Saccoglossus kowalevskii]